MAGGVGATVAVSNVLKGVDLKTMKPNYPGVDHQDLRPPRPPAGADPVARRTARRCRSTRSRKWLKIATVDIEDKRFYQHGGVDYQGIARALLDDLKAGHVVQGASTIEQQLVRNLYLTDSQTLNRKIKEAWLAIQMAEDWSKDKILGTYLNVIPYGGVTYGCEAAAETYFNEHCSELNIRQAALIAGLPAVAHRLQPAPPSRGRPDAPRRGARSDARPGPHHAGPVRARRRPRPRACRPPKHFTRVRQPYFVQYVRDQLRERYGSSALGGGLKVTTTIDPNLQSAAHQAMARSSTSRTTRRRRSWRIDPRTGEILAMQSSTDYSQSKYNLAVQAPPPGRLDLQVLRSPGGDGRRRIDPNTTQYSTAPLVNQPIVPFRVDAQRLLDTCRTRSRRSSRCCRSRRRSSSR